MSNNPGDNDNSEFIKSMANTPERDELFDQAKEVTLKTGIASTANLQRQMGLGYTRAARLMDQLEAAGIVGPSNGAKPRQIFQSEPSTVSIGCAHMAHREDCSVCAPSQPEPPKESALDIADRLIKHVYQECHADVIFGEGVMKDALKYKKMRNL